MIWSIDQNIPAGTCRKHITFQPIALVISFPLDTADPGDGIAFPLVSKSVVSNPFGAVWEVAKAGGCESYGNRIYTSRLWKSQ